MDRLQARAWAQDELVDLDEVVACARTFRNLVGGARELLEVTARAALSAPAAEGSS